LSKQSSAGLRAHRCSGEDSVTIQDFHQTYLREVLGVTSSYAVDISSICCVDYPSDCRLRATTTQLYRKKAYYFPSTPLTQFHGMLTIKVTVLNIGTPPMDQATVPMLWYTNFPSPLPVFICSKLAQHIQSFMNISYADKCAQGYPNLRMRHRIKRASNLVDSQWIVA
jgi:hypothetical protein